MQGKIGFPAIYEVVSETSPEDAGPDTGTIGEILEIDRESRAVARELVSGAARAAS